MLTKVFHIHASRIPTHVLHLAVLLIRTSWKTSRTDTSNANSCRLVEWLNFCSRMAMPKVATVLPRLSMEVMSQPNAKHMYQISMCLARTRMVVARATVTLTRNVYGAFLYQTLAVRRPSSPPQLLPRRHSRLFLRNHQFKAQLNRPCHPSSLL